MKRLIFSLIFLFLFAIPTFAQNIKVQGIAAKGGKIVRTSALVQHNLMETYPSSTITVYLTGTLTLASIFSDEIGTVKANPFTANTDASYFFYIAAGRYDIKFSGTGILTPFTISDVFVDTGGGGGGATVDSVFGRTGSVIAQSGDYDFNQLDFTGSNFNSIETRSASDLNAGIVPDARFPAILPVISGQNLTTLNASNITLGNLDDNRLSANVPLKNAVNTFSANNIFTANVGINTSTPDRRLEVLDGTGAQIRLTAVDNITYAEFFVDSGGTLNILPTGNVTFDTVGNQVNPLNTFSENLGQINKKWLSIHAAELFVETLVAQNTIATIGGRILVAPTNILIQDLTSVATTIFVKYNNLANGDRVYMEGNSSVEFMAVTSGATVVAGGFSYTVTRNLDGTGANDWFAGDAILNTGVAGDGFIDLYSVRGVKSSSQIGPTIVGNVRNSSTYNDWTENWAIGNLNGIYGYGSDIYGVALGKYAAGVPHLTVDATNGIRFFDGLSSVIALWNSSGITLGSSATANVRISSTDVILRQGSTERIHLFSDGSGFLANSLVDWDTAGNFRIRGNATIGGWNVDSDDIFSTGINIRSGASAHIAFGTTPPISATVGTGIFIDRTGIYGLNSNVLQAKMDATNGTIVAGSGRITLDANRLNIDAPVSEIARMRFTSGAAETQLNFLNGVFAIQNIGASGQLAESIINASTSNFSSSTALSVFATPTNISGAIIINIDPVTNTLSDTLTIRHQSTGTTANGFGNALLFSLSTSSSLRDAGRIATLWTDATDGSRTSAITFQTVSSAGALTETFRVAQGGIQLWNGTSMQTITFDAADSCGVGFRCLRIPN